MVSKGSGVHTAIMGMWGMVCAWVCFRITGRRQESCLLCHPATGQAPGCTASALCLCISWETELIHSSVLTSSPHNPHQVLMPSSGQACVCRQVWVMLPPPTGVEGIGKHVDMRQEMAPICCQGSSKAKVRPSLILAASSTILWPEQGCSYLTSLRPWTGLSCIPLKKSQVFPRTSGCDLIWR